MITVNMDKAKNVAHTYRRAARAKEFAPLDIKVLIPSEAVAAEAARQEIRTRYADIQNTIDSSQTIPELRAVVLALPRE
jgi:hypothetical protein